MEWVNYHHLLYFWTVARQGSVAEAARKLRLSQPTVSTQLRALEAQLGVELFDRSRRRLQLTDAGRLAYRYAEEIFGLGQEMLDVLRDRPGARPLRLAVGLAFVLPKLVAYRLLEPALAQLEDMQIEVHEDRVPALLARLAAHELDIVLTDTPLGPEVSVKAFNHPLGQSSVTFFAQRTLAARLRRNFPASLDGAPFLLPMTGTSLRRELDLWFDRRGIRPRIIGAFDDSAVVKVFGQAGHGVFASASVIEQEITAQYDVVVVGRSDEITERFYAITVERRLEHPGSVAICEAARGDLFKP